MKVLVTGGAGFIGSHIVNELLNQKIEVAVLDNLSTGLVENINPAAKLFKLDVVLDDFTRLFAVERFDRVIHLAAQTAVSKSVQEPDFDCRVNILGTVNVLEASRKTGVKRVLFASSAAVYGNVNSIPVPENHPAQPSSFYGLSKLTAENYLKLYSELFGLEHVILRYANVYGDAREMRARVALSVFLPAGF